ncbi:serine/threonine-protein phosphatase 6 regulatory subunit 3 [Phalaenopsis equestris]|uniref:serine/threonine-protein phosphatase 6 regulatory subunit 3 n=1 Tax=Phalaenopsis equestris TaxID=78828 RepID=UPI0009E44F50|nr:serine/threonine-protein phosphatase 6 regulatory subunit 3 [Phalaenopsis equestris]
MFWRMPGAPVASPVDTILDKENCTLEELLDEDETIQECKAMNNRLINFLRERTQVEQLLRYIIEAAPKEADKRRTFKLPFISCEILTCDVDIILQSLLEDDEAMNLLFSFLKPDHPRSTILAGYFSKVVLCLMARKTTQLMSYVQSHPEILHQLIDLIGITSMMEVLIRLIGADENMYSSYTDALQLVDSTDVLDLIVDKFSSSDSPEVHANAAEVLCAITRYAPPGLAAKVCSPSFVGRLFRYALEDSRPKSVLIQSLSVCICLLDPKRLLQSSYQSFRSQLSHGTVVIADPETVDLMLEKLGYLLKLLDVATYDVTLPTTFGYLKPPLGKHRLKILEFISILFTLGSEDAEKELIRLGALRHALDLFFEYPFNNFLHHQVESMMVSCLESKKASLVEHVLLECDIVGKILRAERQPALRVHCDKPTVLAQGRSPPRIGNIGHLTRMANKLVQGAKNNGIIQKHLQENSEWVDWYAKVLINRNSVENVCNWACGRPSSLHDRIRDSDDEDFRDRVDYDVAALASNLNQAFRYSIYNNNDIEEAQGSLEREKEDFYFDDECAEAVISSLRLGDDDPDSSLFTNSNYFAFQDVQVVNDRSSDSPTSPSRNPDNTDEVVVGEGEELADMPTSPKTLTSNVEFQDVVTTRFSNGSLTEKNHESSSPSGESMKPPEWIEWRESTASENLHGMRTNSNEPNINIEVEDQNKDVETESGSR